MMTVHEFLRSLDGPTAVSLEIKVPLTTVHSWGRENRVPEWRMPLLVELANKKGKPVPDSFGPPTPTKKPADKAA